MKIRIVLADDQLLIRDGLKTVLDLEEDLEVIGTAKNGIEAYELVNQLEPDILLLDIRMPEMDGVESIKRISSKNTKVIMLTTFNDETYVLEALATGACGYLLKDMEVKKIVEAIHDAFNNKMIIPIEVGTKLREGLSKLNLKKPEQENNSHEFTDKDKKIIEMMIKGFNNKQIASFLYMSEGTVRNYISNIYAKIGLSDRTQAVLYLKEHFVK